MGSKLVGYINVVSPISHSTPARLTALATAKLPRLALWGLSLVYIFAGLFLRDPWKTDDVVGLATMVTAFREGGITWLLPHIGSLPHAEEGPLITWVGGACMWLFGPLLGDIAAGRLANLIWFAIMTSCVWYGTYLLGRRPEAQPLALPFGGEPSAHDYGRMLADAALLLLIATVGILQRVHETSVVPAIMACQAVSFYALARMMDRPFIGATTLAIAVSSAFLTRGWVGAFPIILGATFGFYPGSILWQHRRWLPWVVGLTAVLMLAWWIPASNSTYWIHNWQAWNRGVLAWPQLNQTLRTLRDLPWYLWPIWPLALLATWRWRAWVFTSPIWQPFVMTVCSLFLLFFLKEATDAEYILIAVPCTALAAFSLPTLRRGVINTLDWFALMCFSLTAATVWLGWFALNFSWPADIANNIARHAVGYKSVISWSAFALALAVTAAWVTLVVWRLHVRPAALWRGTVLSAGGLTTTWILLVLLWQPTVNYARSYRSVSGQLAQALAQYRRPGECVQGLDLSSGPRASFLVFNNLNFPSNPQCTLVLQQTTRNSLRDGTVVYRLDAEVLWQGGRSSDSHEVYRLLRIHPYGLIP